MSPNAIPTTTRTRVNRRKADDDSAYIGSSGISRKRVATDAKLDGPDRNKRKRVDGPSTVLTSVSYPVSHQPPPGPLNMMSRKLDHSDSRPIYMDFAALPAAALHRYLVHYNLVPPMELLTSQNPPLPGSLMNAQAMARQATPEASSVISGTTPANRPRRDLKEVAQKRRSSRFLEEDLGDRFPVLADIGSAHHAYALIAERHFQEKAPVKEAEVLTSFLHAVARSRGPDRLPAVTSS